MKTWVKQYAFGFGLLALFAVTFSYVILLTSSQTFADPDSFYHVKMAQDIAAGKDIRNFPWLPFTVLNSYYTDQHFLYHVFLAPFVAWLSPFSGAKLATALIAAVLVCTFVYFLKKIHVRLPLLYGFLLLIVLPFIFRISLTKAPGFSLTILLIGLMFAFLNRPIAVFITAFIYVWSYGGFILFPIFTLLLVAFKLFSRWWQESAWLRSRSLKLTIEWGAFFKKFFTRKEVYVAIAVIAGTVIGVVANPFFPNNIKYLNDQLIQIGIVNYQKVIGVGGEWYPYAFMDLVSNTIILSVLLVAAIVVGAINAKRLKLRTWYFALLYVLFLLFTLKSRRYVEYYVPFGMLFVASTFSDCLEGVDLWHMVKRLRKHLWSRYTLLVAGLSAYIIIALAVIVPRDVLGTKKDLSGGFGYTQDRGAAEWLKQHTPKGSIVVHSDWDEFPYLLYWNDQNRYIAGLDPTFLYKKDKNIYWDWVNLTTGKTTTGVGDVIANNLNSGYILIETGHDVLLNNVRNDPSMIELYADSDARIFAHKKAPIL